MTQGEIVRLLTDIQSVTDIPRRVQLLEEAQALLIPLKLLNHCVVLLQSRAASKTFRPRRRLFLLISPADAVLLSLRASRMIWTMIGCNILQDWVSAVALLLDGSGKLARQDLAKVNLAA